MPNLHITVVDKKATYNTRDGVLVCENTDYKVIFTFDEEWSAHETKTARFIWNGAYHDVEFTGTECAIPKVSRTNALQVGVYAGELYTTTPALIPCLRSVLCETSKAQNEDVEAYRDRAEKAAESAEARAEAAKFFRDDAMNWARDAESSMRSAWEAADEAASYDARTKTYMEVTQGLMTDAVSIDSRISLNSKRISNLEAGIPAEDFVTDSSAAYVRDVPSNALPFAEIAEIGGVTRKCTNLIPFPYKFTSGETSGVSYTVSNDGGVTYTGTATAQINPYYVMGFLLKAGTYFLSGCPSGGSWETYQLFVQTEDYNTTIANDFGAGRRFTLEEDTYVNICFIVSKDATVSGLTVRPMLNTGDTALPYEPYFSGLRSAPVTEVVSEGVNLTTAQAVYKGAQRYEELVADGRNCIRFTSGASYETTPITFAPNTQYTVSFYAKGEDFGGATTGNTAFTFYYEDGTFSKVAIGQASPWMFISLTSTSGKTVKSVGVSANEYRAYVYIDTDTFMLNKGTTAQPYRPYIKRTLSIPEAVQALPDYGIGIPNTDYFNRIRWRYDEATDKWVREYVKQIEKIVLDGSSDEQWYLFRENQYGAFVYQTSLKSKQLAISDKFTFEYGAWGNKGVGYFSPNGNDVFFNTDKATVEEWKTHIAENPVTVFYALATPEITDISHLLPEDNLIGVEGGGSITMQNEYGYDVPATVTYQVEEATL